MYVCMNVCVLNECVNKGDHIAWGFKQPDAIATIPGLTTARAMVTGLVVTRDPRDLATRR